MLYNNILLQFFVTLVADLNAKCNKYYSIKCFLNQHPLVDILMETNVVMVLELMHFTDET